jgi:DNA repair photolyase
LIAIGTATDPYQPAERRFEMTRSILEEFANYEGYDIGIVTKSNLVVRDADVLRRIGERNKIYVNVTVTTLDYRLAHLLEPRAPRPDLRLEAVRELNSVGVPAGVICAPVLPGITDGVRELDALVKAARDHNAVYIYANPLFLKPCSAAVFLPFLEKEFPHLAKPYRERYGERAFVSQAYAKRISTLMAKLREKHGLPARRDHVPQRGDSVGNALIRHGAGEEQVEQMSLFAKSA